MKRDAGGKEVVSCLRMINCQVDDRLRSLLYINSCLSLGISANNR